MGPTLGGTFGKSVCCWWRLNPGVSHLGRGSASPTTATTTTTLHTPPAKVPKIICIFRVTTGGFILADVTSAICCERVLSPPTPVKGHFLVLKLFDWTAEPNPAVKARQCCFGPPERFRRPPAVRRTAEISFHDCKKQNKSL